MLAAVQQLTAESADQAIANTPGGFAAPANSPGIARGLRPSQVPSGTSRSLHASALVIQRKAFIGPEPGSATRAVLVDPGNERAGEAPSAQIPEHNGNLGTGERNVSTIVTDRKSRYFRSLSELYGYATRQTRDIGYVDREKTWVRLPGQFLVLGERHDGTTLPDLVGATGTQRYVYEREPTGPSPYLHPGAEAPPHALEQSLPKLVVGLIGVEQQLRSRLDSLPRIPGAQVAVRLRPRTAARADPAAAQVRYQAELANWSSDWESKHEDAQDRGEHDPSTGGDPARDYSGYSGYRHTLLTPPPERPYTREASELAATGRALEELRTATRGHDDPITDFYIENQTVIDKTIVQLNRGLPIELTEMFQAMARGRFDLHHLIDRLETAAENEFAGVEDISKHEKYRRHYETAEAGWRMEELRDSYMFRRILAAKAAGDRLAGLGDNHRMNLQKVFKKDHPDILVQRWIEFYADQYRRHPDRE